MERFARNVIRFRWVILVTVTGLTLFFGYGIRKISINSDVINSLNDQDPTAELYKKIGARFGGNEVGMIVLECEDVFRPDVLRHIREITDSVEFTAGVSSVTSLTNIIDIRSSEWGIEIGPLLDEYNLPGDSSTLDSLKHYVLSRDMYRGVIVSDDGTASVIIFNLLDSADKQATAKTIKTRVGAMNLPENLYFGGLPFLLNDITTLILSDIIWLLPVTFLIIALFLFLSFKSLRGVFLPLLTAGISVVWTTGLMAVTGYDLTLTSSYIPVVLLAVSTAYTIHVLNSYEVNRLVSPKQAVVRALTYTAVPVVLASVTTIIGFVSFIFGSYLQMIREFGVFTAVGTLFALLLSLFFVPAIISFLSPRDNKRLPDKKNPGNLLTRVILEPLYRLIIRYPGYTVIFWSVLLLISIGGIFLIRTNVNITNYFKENNPTRITENLMQKKFGGSLPIYVVFEGDMQSPEVLNLMIKTEKFMKEDPNISMAESVADLVERMNEAMGEGKSIPGDRAKIEQLWFLLDGQEIMSQLVNDDLDEGIIQSKFASIKTGDIDAFIHRINGFIRDNQSGSCTIEVTGIPSIYYKLNKSLIRSQYSSLIIAVILVMITVGLILRSLLKGIFAAVPIIATILILLGFMGFTGIPLDIATVLVGSIALGIGIDYSIHIISGFNTHLKGTGEVEKALEKTLLVSGKAVIINAASVAAGFLVLRFSHLVPFQHFGILIAISMIGSSVGALTLLPVILMYENRKKKNIHH